AFFGEVSEVRSPEQFKSVFPKGLQVARENVERGIATGQDVFGRTLKTQEAIGQIAKAQFEAQATAATEQVAQAAQAAKAK
ncbi:MAG TPA: phasin family protein, partial [Lysobacter sp.]|nr:phasin family protein [Lysobacter sp.]